MDEKGRTIIPLKFRGELGSSFMVAKSTDKCLILYPMDEWMKVVKNIEAQPFSGEAMRRTIRQFLAGACECEVDKQGRLLIPITLREYAGIKTEVNMNGMGSKAEIWDSETWTNYRDFKTNEKEELDAATKAREILGF